MTYHNYFFPIRIIICRRVSYQHQNWTGMVAQAPADNLTCIFVTLDTGVSARRGRGRPPCFKMNEKVVLWEKKKSGRGDFRISRGVGIHWR
jgi:hypothetical protein